jgi:chemotaxis protein MotB
MARRKKQHGENHPDERWLLTYADMITLLMALFMILYAMSVVNVSKFQKLKVTLKQAFSSAVLSGGTSILDHGSTQSSLNDQNSEKTGADTLVNDSGGQPTPGSQSGGQTTDAAAAALAASAQEKDLRATQQHLQALINRTRFRNSVQVYIDERGLVIRLITDKVLFAPGSWELQPTLEPLLASIAHQIEPLPNHVRIEGNTDGIPFAGPGGIGNDELSSNRAWAVYHYLDNHGFDAAGHDTGALGWGSRMPLDSRHLNSTTVAQPKNRRVEIVLLRQRFDGADPGTTVTPIGPVGAPISPADIARASRR